MIKMCEDDIDFESMMDSLNVTGQRQPVTVPRSDDSWDDKILVDPFFTSHMLPNLTPQQHSNDELFNVDIDHLINSEQTGLVSSFDEINENYQENPTFEQVHFIDGLHNSMPLESFSTEYHQRQSFSYSTGLLAPIPVGSSPVEQNRFDQSRINERQNWPDELSIYTGDAKPCPSLSYSMDLNSLVELLKQCDPNYQKKIQIMCQPRSKFRPRTKNESAVSAHYIRCEEGVKPEYPTISVPVQWKNSSTKNYIEVALVGLDKELHAYALENKSAAMTFDENTTIFKLQNNVLFFLVSEEDFSKGNKTFMIELIKSKQDETVTKDLIRDRQLEKSMLRFRRFFAVADGSLCVDESSETFSEVMMEDYGNLEVEHVGPRFGPMAGQEMVYVMLKGRFRKEEIVIEINEPTIGWKHEIGNATKNGNFIYFPMPSFPNPGTFRAIANIVVKHKGRNEDLFQMPYVYDGSVDSILSTLSLDDQSDRFSGFTNETNCDAYNLLFAAGPSVRGQSSRKMTSKSAKRLRKV